MTMTEKPNLFHIMFFLQIFVVGGSRYIIDHVQKFLGCNAGGGKRYGQGADFRGAPNPGAAIVLTSYGLSLPALAD